MALQVLLVRHGQTDSNAGGILQGHLPTPLNELGRQQAVRLAGRLAMYVPPIDALVTSDLRRAVETAEPVERDLGLDARRDPSWRERGFGTFEGRTVGDTEVWRATTGTINPPGAESIDNLRIRVERALDVLLDEHRTRRCVAVVTHGGVIRTTLQLLVEGRLPLADGQRVPEAGPILNGSILHLEVTWPSRTRPTWRIVRVNDVDHLETDAVTTLGVG